MINPTDQTKSPSQSQGGGDEDVIELTEVVAEEAGDPAAENAAEVVLDFGGKSDLASLKYPEMAPEEKPPAPPAAPAEESLDDFLASLPELPEDLDISAEPPPPATPPAPDLGQGLAGRLSDAELEELVRRVIQETVERLARELFPKIAAEAIDRELTLWKKRLTEPY